METEKKHVIFNEAFMKTILENMAEIVMVYDVEGKLLYTNFLAKTRDNSNHKPLSESDPLNNKGLYLADGKTPINPDTNPIFRVLKGEVIINEEIWVMPKGKPLTILQINGRAIYDHNYEIIGALIVSHDITEQRWAQQRLTVSEQRYKSLYYHNLDIVCWFDLNGNFLNVNPATEKITGYQLNDLINQSVKQFLQGKDWNKIVKISLRAKKGLSQNFETSIIHKHGNTLFLHITIVPITVENNVVGMYAIAKDITARKKDEQMINYLAYHDTLTSLPNRRVFHKNLHDFILKEKKHTSILFIDLDRFKLINDTLGHSIGDALLRQVARRLSLCVGEENTVYRFGGDEFTIILPNGTRKNTENIAEHILKEFVHPFKLDNQEYIITPSIGISEYPLNGLNAEELIRKADTAMYRAKEQGKNIFKFYTEDLNEPIIRKMKIEKELHKALEQDQFVIHYQPQVSLNGEIQGMEALIRWQHPELGFVSPAEFIPIAEETGLIISIGRWVLTEACKQNKLWQDAGLSPIRVAVNLSARQFHDEKLVSIVKQVLMDTALDPKYLELEITESIAMQDGTSVVAKLQSLKQIGITIAIDDFGTGYSSLSYLKKYPLDTLKIDRSFIASITDEADELAIVKAIIMMAKSLNLKVLAEGVETVEQKNLLHSLGCDEFQGYFYSKPLPIEQLKLHYSK